MDFFMDTWSVKSYGCLTMKRSAYKKVYSRWPSDAASPGRYQVRWLQVGYLVLLTTGCPFTFEKFTGRSHPFGKNVTYGPINNTPEKCKHWCLVRAYCVGVDFSVSTSTCYFLREINDMLLVSAPTVNHYQKTNCARENITTLTLWRPLFPCGYSYKASCARPG